MAISTKQHYSYVLSAYVEPSVGALRVREATVEHLDRALVTIREQHGWEVNATVIRVQGVRRLAELQGKGRLAWDTRRFPALRPTRATVSPEGGQPADQSRHGVVRQSLGQPAADVGNLGWVSELSSEPCSLLANNKASWSTLPPSPGTGRTTHCSASGSDWRAACSISASSSRWPQGSIGFHRGSLPPRGLPEAIAVRRTRRHRLGRLAGWLAENEQWPEWLVRHGAIVLSGVGLAELSSFDDVVRLLVQPAMT